MSGSSSYRTNASFKHRHSSLEDGVGRVSHACIDIAIFGPGEFSCSVSRVVEVVCRRLIKGYRSRPIYGIRFLPAVDCNGIKTGLPRFHALVRTIVSIIIGSTPRFLTR